MPITGHIYVETKYFEEQYQYHGVVICSVAITQIIGDLGNKQILFSSWHF